MTTTITKTTHGEVQGREKEGVLLFGGIPYAAPPTGRRRFRAAEPHGGWAGVREARRFGPAAPQPREEGLTSNPQVRWDEDCLTLNVCTPAIDGARRPVLVWIHGGGFRTGQGAIPWYNGTSFALRGDIVTVSINYRLGALGFAHLEEIGGADYASSGLNGIRDQLAALHWVRENIAAFGGDPERVTVAGESAGAMSVGILLGCPAAAGLFRAAILQSGAAHAVLGREEGNHLGRCFVASVGAGSLDDLVAAPVERILEAQMEIERRSRSGDLRPRAGSGIGGMPFQPVVDGRLLPQPPIDALRGGLSSDVRVLVGTNRDEMTLFPVGEIDEDRLQRLAGRIFGEADASLAAYRREWPAAAAEELFVAMMTDRVFRIPAVRLAEAQAHNGGTAYQYLFTWESRAFGGRLKATHALEIPFMFNNLARAGTEVFLGPGPTPQGLADAMHAAWIAFIRTGDPSCVAVGDWPVYRPAHRAVMELGEQVGVRVDPYGATSMNARAEIRRPLNRALPPVASDGSNPAPRSGGAQSQPDDSEPVYKLHRPEAGATNSPVSRVSKEVAPASGRCVSVTCETASSSSGASALLAQTVRRNALSAWLLERSHRIWTTGRCWTTNGCVCLESTP